MNRPRRVVSVAEGLVAEHRLAQGDLEDEVRKLAKQIRELVLMGSERKSWPRHSVRLVDGISWCCIPSCWRAGARLFGASRADSS